jgi:selenocysteine-specific elongation factor
MGNLILLDREELSPGETVVVQIRLDSPVTVVKDDRFVIRSYSPVRTIGGGRVLNPIPVKHKRYDEAVVAGLQGLADYAPDEVINFHVGQAGYAGAAFSDLKLMTNLPEKQLQDAVSKLLSQNRLLQIDRDNRVYIHSDSFEKLKQDALGCLGQYHEAKPLKAGMPKEEFKSKLPPSVGTKMFNLLLVQLTKKNSVIQEEDTIRLAEHKVSLKVDQADVSRKIIKIYQDNKLTPPYFRELSKSLDIDPDTARDVLLLLVEQGKIIKVKDDLYFDQAAVENLEKELVAFLKENGEITTPQFKEMTAASRKYVIPLIEYYDAKNVTIRVGDIRKLRSG